NPTAVFNQGYGTSFHGTDATLVVNRSGYWIYPNAKGAEVVEVRNPDLKKMNEPHWANFLECIRTRKKPQSDIEACVRSSASGIREPCVPVSAMIRTIKLGPSSNRKASAGCRCGTESPGSWKSSPAAISEPRAPACGRRFD